MTKAQNSSPGVYKETTEPLKVEPPDGGWGWVIVGVSFVNFMMMTGLLRSYGVFHIHILNTFPEYSEARISIIPSMLVTLINLSAPVSSALCERFPISKVASAGGLICALGLMASFFAPSVEFLYISYGVVVGVGSGISTMPGILLTARYFKKRRARANGICAAGTSFGSFIIPPIAEFFCQQYTFRGALLLFGGLVLNTCALAFLFKTPEHFAILKQRKLAKLARREQNMKNGDDSVTHPLVTEENGKDGAKTDENQKELLSDKTENGEIHSNETEAPVKAKKQKHRFFLDFSFLKDPVFLAILGAGAFFRVSVPQVLFYLPAHARDLEIGLSEASLLLSIAAISDLIGRMGYGWISDRKFMQRPHEYTMTMIVAALGALILPFFHSYALLVVSVVLYGLGAGASVILLPVILTDTFGADRLPSSLGIMRAFQAMATFSAPPITGFIKDATGRYSSAFFFMGGALVFGACSMLLMPVMLERQKRKNEAKPVNV